MLTPTSSHAYLSNLPRKTSIKEIKDKRDHVIATFAGYDDETERFSPLKPTLTSSHTYLSNLASGISTEEIEDKRKQVIPTFPGDEDETEQFFRH